MAEGTPAPPAVTDHRTPPRGVLPRHLQTWLLMGLALAVLGIIAFAGQPEPPVLASTMTPVESTAPSPGRVRDFQDRLRVIDARTRQEAPLLQSPPPNAGAAFDNQSVGRTPDPVEAERRRREYESLFASNVVMSRRPEAQRLMADQRLSVADAPGSHRDSVPGPPSLDAVADAVMRATTRYAQPTAAAAQSLATPEATTTSTPTSSAATATRPASTGPISSTGPLHRILEGTVIETVLTNRLDGSVAAPVNCLVTTPVYSHDGQHVLVPAGSRVLGETQPVQSFGETRLAVAFNRLVLPDGRTYRLDQFMGLNAIGEAGLRDQVNQHYRSTFGASAAVGLLTGFAQFLGARGLNSGNGDRTVVIAGNVGDATAQATAQTMNRFLNRLPTVTIREGHRVTVYLTGDLELPAYDVAGRSRPGLLAQGQ
jgi:type IV secretory pathway VirB10-like protein